MNATRFDSELAAILQDPSGDVFSDDQRAVALAGAVREYSRIEPLSQRFGTGTVYASAAAADTHLIVAGGPFLPGNSVTIDKGLPSEETLVLGALQTFDQTTVGLIGNPLKFAVPALGFAHDAGADVSLATVGLLLVVGQDKYILPGDFMQPDQSSFDIAVGAKSSVRRRMSYYDAIYEETARLSSVGGSPFGRSGSVGGRNPNGIPGGVSSACAGRTYRFLISDRPRLVVTPTPTISSRLDFYYLACHTASTVPDMRSSVLMDGAIAACCFGAAAAVQSDFSGKSWDGHGVHAGEDF
jgi:hypothetical protein